MGDISRVSPAVTRRIPFATRRKSARLFRRSSVSFRSGWGGAGEVPHSGGGGNWYPTPGAPSVLPPSPRLRRTECIPPTRRSFSAGGSHHLPHFVGEENELREEFARRERHSD